MHAVPRSPFVRVYAPIWLGPSLQNWWVAVRAAEPALGDPSVSGVAQVHTIPEEVAPWVMANARAIHPAQGERIKSMRCAGLSATAHEGGLKACTTKSV